MLARAAAKRAAPFTLLAAEAHALPFSTRAFDLVACVNALHHFGEPRRFLESAIGLLQAGGALVVIGMDPSVGRDRWYLYDYFPESLRPDLDRYPPHAALRRWMRDLGLERVTTRTAQRIQGVFEGERVFDDPILHRNGTSQLTLLDDGAFERGMARIRDAVSRPGPSPSFVTDIWLPVTRGFVPR
jgi:SAM-dependent methyltransferase